VQWHTKAAECRWMCYTCNKPHSIIWFICSCILSASKYYHHRFSGIQQYNLQNYTATNDVPTVRLLMWHIHIQITNNIIGSVTFSNAVQYNFKQLHSEKW